MWQDLPPATFYEPNIFDLYSADELVSVVKEAMFNTLTIIDCDKTNYPITLYNSGKIANTIPFSETANSQSYNKLQMLNLQSSGSQPPMDKIKKYLQTQSEQCPLHWAAI